MKLKLTVKYLVICSIGLVLLLAWRERLKTTVSYDIIIRQGTIYDGSGSKPFIADIAIQHDTIAAIGDLQEAAGKKEIDARGLAVSPGFINMLSWADQNLLKDGRSLSNIKQGVPRWPARELHSQKHAAYLTHIDVVFRRWRDPECW